MPARCRRLPRSGDNNTVSRAVPHECQHTSQHGRAAGGEHTHEDSGGGGGGAGDVWRVHRMCGVRGVRGVRQRRGGRAWGGGGPLVAADLALAAGRAVCNTTRYTTLYNVNWRVGDPSLLHNLVCEAVLRQWVHYKNIPARVCFSNMEDK